MNKCLYCKQEVKADEQAKSVLLACHEKCKLAEVTKEYREKQWKKKARR